MKKILRLALGLGLFSVVSLQAQVTVNSTSGPSTTATYTSVNTAFESINQGNHTGVITIDVNGLVNEGTAFTPTALAASGQGPASYSSIVLRPTATSTITGSAITGRGLLELDGADNVTIDGDIIGGPVNKDLLIENTAANTIANTAVIRLIGRTTAGLGATFNTIKNCIIRGTTPGNDGASGSTITSSYGIIFGGATLPATGDNNDNNIIDNNNITRAYIAVYNFGTATNTSDNGLIINNNIGSNIAGENITFGGLNLSAVTTSTIQQNQIFNLKMTTSSNNYGIQVAGASSNSLIISRNNITGIWQTSTGGWGAYGINITAGTNFNIVNNTISDIQTTNYSNSTTLYNAFGIRFTGGTNMNVYYNSVNIAGSYTYAANTTAASAALLITATGFTGNIKNNIFSNTMTSTATSASFVAVWMPAFTNYSSVNINNNAYMVPSSSSHFVARGSALYQTLSAFQPISQNGNGTNDVASVPFVNSGGAPFVSVTNLNIPANTTTPIESGAVLIPALGTNIDFNAAVRPLAGVNPNLAPDIGAYELDGITPPNCSGAPAASSVVATSATICSASSVGLSLSTTYTLPGISYQWQVSTGSASGPYTNITGATGSAYTATNVTVTSWYQAVITCVAGPVSTTATAVQINIGGNACQCNTYCASAATSAADDEIFNVSIGTLNNTSNCSQTGGPGSVLNMYSNYTGIVAAPTLVGGSTYTLSVTVGMCGTGSYSGIITAFFDFNNNGSFADPGELVYTSPYTQYAIAGTQMTTAVTIPATVTPGITRMRIVEVESSTAQGPCGSYTWGEAEDYCVNFMAAPACSGAPGSNTVVSPMAAICPSTTANLSLANSYSVAGLSYQWYSSPTLSGPYTAISGATLNAYTTPSLTASTYYQAVITCINGPASTTATPLQIVVGGNSCLCAAYCAAAATSAADDEIFNVTIGTLNNTSSCSTLAGGPGSILNRYSNYAGIVAAPTLTAGYTYTMDVVVGQCGAGQYSGGVTVYMDFNANGSFADPGEMVYASPTTLFATAGTTVSATVTLPVSALSGTTRMRVIAVENGLNQLPCTNYTWGETEDYCINIVPPPPCTNAVSGTITTTSYSVCSGQTISLVATGATIGTGITYNWQVGAAANGPYTNVIGGNGATTTSYTTAPLTAGTAYYVLEVVCSLASATAVTIPSATVVVNPTPSASAATIAPICAGQNVAFTSTTDIGTSFNWTGPNAFTSTQQNPTIAAATSSATGNYTLLISTPSCSAAPVVVNVVVNSTNLNIMASPPALCTSGSSTLTAIGNATAVTWNTSATTTSIVVSPATTTTYSVVGTGTSNCVATAVTTISVINPTITGIGASVCTPTSVGTLSATAFGPVNWYATSTPTNPIGSGNTFTATAATTTTYYAQANSTATSSITTTFIGGNGASGNMFNVTALNTITIDGVDMHFATANVTTTVEVWYRVGSFVGFESSNAGWTMAYTTTVITNGANMPTPIPGTFAINVPSGQTYAIYVTTINGNPTTSYTNGTLLNQLYTSNSDLQLFEGKGGGYFSVINSPRVFNGTLKYTKVGCTSPIIPVVLTTGATPTIIIASSQPSVCPGGTVNIGVTGANTYTWSTGANGALISPTVNATTNYSVVGESSPGCASTASITIAAGAVPTVSATSSASLICNGQTATLTASGANTYLWSTTSTNTSIPVAPSVTTSYTVTGTGANGCTNTYIISQGVSPCTGINNNVTAVNGILVYPNPNTGEFTIELNNGSVKNIEVMDLTGRIVVSNSSNNDKVDFNIKNLANGVYYVRIQSNNTVDVIKIVKQ